MSGLASVASDAVAMGKAEEVCRRVFDGLPRQKDAAVRMMMAACAHAKEAYRIYVENDAGEPTSSDQISAGNFAYLFVAGMSEVQSILGKPSYGEALDALQATAKWLKSRGWHGILEFGIGNRVLYKTATEVHADMMEYRRSGMRIRREIAGKRGAR